MTITFTKAYVANGKTYATLEEAQIEKLYGILASAYGTAVNNSGTTQAEILRELASDVLKCKDEIIDILTTTATSKPSARKINGGTKKRKPKTPEQPQLPNTEAA